MSSSDEFSRFRDGASFVLDAPEFVPPIWGDDHGDVLWARGEPLLIVGPPGVGKTTLAQQLVLGRCGIRPAVDPLLGLPVKPGAEKTVYIAADRPQQAA